MRGLVDCGVVVFDCLNITKANFSLQIMKDLFQIIFNYYAEK